MSSTNGPSSEHRRFARAFFARDSVRVARALLGAIVVHESDEGTAAGRIVEVEAYRGPADRAAHSYGGRRTARNEVMYGPPGRAYVYFVYGMHHCLNVVTAEVDVPEAVLIRALDPVAGLDLMRRRRGLAAGPDHVLARGPGNVCRALGVDRQHNGLDLVSGRLRIEPGRPLRAARIERAPRVGVDYAGDDARLPWRLFERGHPAVSKASGAKLP